MIGGVRTAIIAALCLVLAACPSPYRERPPETSAPVVEEPTTTDEAVDENVRSDPTPEPDYEPPRMEVLDPPPEEPARTPISGDTTVIGTIGADGTLRADTLAGVRADTSRVRRETVVTGAVRARAELPATGYRVQIFATEDRNIAARIASDLNQQGLEEPVYVELDDPWFKVRVGDFDDRTTADRARARLVELGFPGAWIVQTTIRTAP